jgi:hypothetical protein
LAVIETAALPPPADAERFGADRRDELRPACSSLYRRTRRPRFSYGRAMRSHFTRFRRLTVDPSSSSPTASSIGTHLVVPMEMQRAANRLEPDSGVTAGRERISQIRVKASDPPAFGIDPFNGRSRNRACIPPSTPSRRRVDTRNSGRVFQAAHDPRHRDGLPLVDPE